LNEGFLLKFKDIIWMVKGIEHLEGFLVAFPRYKGKAKVVDPSLIVSSFNLYKTCDCAPVPVPLVPMDRSEVLDPRSLIEADKEAKDLASVIAKGAGLTGSRAVGIEGGDIDLVYYSNFNEVIKALKELKEDGEVTTHLGKWDSLGERAIEYRLKNSILEGKWRGTPFSIRLVSPPRAPSRPVRLKRIKKRGRIVSAQAYVMPYTYVLDDGTVIESLRLQHSELRKDMCVEVDGYWEMSTRGGRLHLGLGSKLDVICC